MGICSDCKHWNTTGFGTDKSATVGKCDLVARNWYPYREDKKIALSGTGHAKPMSEGLIFVVTRREFGCNQWSQK